MRIINSDISAELQKEVLQFFAMVEFVFGSATYRYNETEESIYDADGNKYLPRSFTFANIDTTSGMSASSIDIVIDNTDQVISAILLGEDVRNKTVKIYIGAVTKEAGTAITLLNSGLETWSDSTHCTSWSLGQDGTGGTLERDGTQVKAGTYSAKVTVGTASTYIAQSLGTTYNGRNITVGCWCKSANTIANRVMLLIHDVVGGSIVNIDYGYYQNSGDWEYLVANIPVAAANTGVVIQLRVGTTANAPAYFDVVSAITGKAEWDEADGLTPIAGVTEIVVEEFMRGIVGGWELSEDNKATITIQNEFILWAKKTLRVQSSSCPWVFKGTECTYAGQETWCDQSYPRCKALENSDYFGGFRFLPSITGTEIKWGGQ
jgi:hypothetical protein